MRRARGFTLVEVMIAVTILAFVMAGISAVLIKQTQASAKQSLDRDLEGNGRLALLEIGRAARLAGYGITPLAAFDFDRYGCATPGNAATCPNGGRDRVDGPDELVVSFRDPVFYRNVIAKNGFGPYTVTIDRALTVPLNAGRMVQLLCSGAEPAAYLAVANDAAAGGTVLTLRGATDADGSYPTAAPADACFDAAALMLVERVRYYIANDGDGVPALFKERGRGAPEKLFRGIEDLQLSYDIGQPPPGSPFAAVGATPAPPPVGCGTGWTFGVCAAAGTPSSAAAAPDWRNDQYDSANRYTGHAANIRRVNIGIVARSVQPSPDQSGAAVPLVGNRPARPADRFRRSVLTLTEQPDNLLTRAHFLPPVFANSNVGGG